MAKPLYLSDDENNKILADYIETHNFSEAGRMNGVSDDYVRRLVKKNEDVVRNCLEQKKEENTKSTLEYMQTQHEAKKRILDKILKAIEEKAEDVNMFTNIKDLATAYGIILDKELKVLELSKNNQEEKTTKITIVNSLPKEDNNEPNS